MSSSENAVTIDFVPSQPGPELNLPSTSIAPAPKVAAGPACPNCQAPGVDTTQTWCRRCGYYAVLGKCLELDPWEREAEPGAAPTVSQAAKPRGPFAALLHSIPRWAWPVIGASVAIVVISAPARLVTSPGLIRSVWGGGQFLIGLLAFVIAHGLAFVYAMSHLDSCGMLDFLFRPFAVWSPVVRELPRRTWQLFAGVCGLTAALSALLLIGVPYELLFDGKVAERAQKSLTRAVREAETGKDKAAPPAQPAPVEEKPAELPQTIECVVIGFKPSSDNPNDFTSLIVASVAGGRLKVVGRVSDGFDEPSRAELRRRLAEIRRATPFLDCRDRATWVEPRVVCRIRFARWSKRDTLEEPQFESLLTGL